jgi:hypothetical protein
MANLTVDLIYRRLAPGVLAKLRELNPKDEHGRRKNKLFQWLTADIGENLCGASKLRKTATFRESSFIPEEAATALS